MAKKTPAFTRTTITVPTALKRKMDKVAKGINWSALAARAFEQKLIEIATKKEKRDMSDVVQRLKLSKQRAESEQYRAGLEHGREWARNQAEWDELDRLDTLRNELDVPNSDWDSWFRQEGDQAFGIAENLAFVINPGIQGFRQDAQNFWYAILGEEKRIAGDFVRGFAEGALEVFDAVQEEL